MFLILINQELSIWIKALKRIQKHVNLRFHQLETDFSGSSLTNLFNFFHPVYKYNLAKVKFLMGFSGAKGDFGISSLVRLVKQ